jgi:hypothetical protein
VIIFYGDGRVLEVDAASGKDLLHGLDEFVDELIPTHFPAVEASVGPSLADYLRCLREAMNHHLLVLAS